MVDIDAVAEAIWRADRPNEAAHYAWNECIYVHTYRHMAQAALDAMQLKPERKTAIDAGLCIKQVRWVSPWIKEGEK